MVRPLSLASREPFSLCPYMDYITLLFIYFVPETMPFYPPNESSPYLFQGFCTCCCLSRKFLHWLFALLSLSHHPTQLKWHLFGEDFITFNDYLPPCHSTMLEFLQSWESTSSLSANLLSLKVSSTVLSMG